MKGWISFLLFVLVVGELVLLVSSFFDRGTQRIIRLCSKEAQRQACYDREIPKLMGKLSMEEVFAVTKKVQAEDPSYAYCHVLGHTLSTVETRKDPNKWKEVITRCPSGVCSNGCLHGAFQERFRSETLSDEKIAEILPEVDTVCEARGSWSPTGLERASCYHALGHLLMYITGAEINRATTVCDQIANKGNRGDFRKVCFDGAFMQIFQPLEPEDRALLKGKEQIRASHAGFCAKFSGRKKTACISEGWPLYLDDLRQPEGLLGLCSLLSGDAFAACMDSVLYVLVVQFRFDLSAIRDYCSRLPQPFLGRCFALTASRLIETDYRNMDKAIDWCQQSEEYDETQSCFGQLVKESDFIFQKGSGKWRELCQKMPARWQAACLYPSYSGLQSGTGEKAD